MPDVQRDNSTFKEKLALRRALLKLVEDPIVLEAHGGAGAIWQRLYSGFEAGIVFEKDPRKAEFLARQRPTWSVYEGDCTRGLVDGAGGHLPVNYVDIDPYGDPWPTIAAFFLSERPRTDRVALAVNDGLRQRVRLGLSWKTKTLEGVVQRWGNNQLYVKYLDVCQELMEEAAKPAGYHIERWFGYHTGDKQMMTHYAAVLVR